MSTVRQEEGEPPPAVPAEFFAEVWPGQAVVLAAGPVEPFHHRRQHAQVLSQNTSSS